MITAADILKIFSFLKKENFIQVCIVISISSFLIMVFVRDFYPHYIKISFIVSFVAIIISFGQKLVLHIKIKKTEKNRDHKILQELQRLSKNEKSILRKMISENANSHYATIVDTPTNSLAGKRILEKCFNPHFEPFHHNHKNPYNMPDFVWDHIKDDPNFKTLNVGKNP